MDDGAHGRALAPRGPGHRHLPRLHRRAARRAGRRGAAAAPRDTCTSARSSFSRAWRPASPVCSRRAHAAGATTSLDPNWDPSGRWDGGLAEVLPAVDVLFVNAAEAAAVSGAADPARRGDGARRPRPAAGGQARRRRRPGARRVPPGARLGPGVDVADTVGAGDSFDAGFLCARLLGWEVSRCSRARRRRRLSLDPRGRRRRRAAHTRRGAGAGRRARPEARLPTRRRPGPSASDADRDLPTPAQRRPTPDAADEPRGWWPRVLPALEIAAANRRGEAVGLTSVCSAERVVLETALRRAAARGTSCASSRRATRSTRTAATPG